ncbi:hypothetical protein [Pararhizobium haloflavum]|uniref:hypothetical protein n=1 Tax=Pararhizobium haloflavum TaxID=2037914 RepID=UPI000C1A4D6E|nr:hypothetical protein [Pararhizobium haloflavum]
MPIGKVAELIGVPQKLLSRWRTMGELAGIAPHPQKKRSKAVWEPDAIRAALERKKRQEAARSRPAKRSGSIPKKTRSTSPTVRQIFNAADAKDIRMVDIQQATSRGYDLIMRWRYGKNLPSIAAVEEMAEACGLEIVVREKSEAE